MWSWLRMANDRGIRSSKQLLDNKKPLLTQIPYGCWMTISTRHFQHSTWNCDELPEIWSTNAMLAILLGMTKKQLLDAINLQVGQHCGKKLLQLFIDTPRDTRSTTTSSWAHSTWKGGWVEEKYPQVSTKNQFLTKVSAIRLVMVC